MKRENYKSNPVEIQERLNPNRRMQVEQNRIYFGNLSAISGGFVFRKSLFEVRRNTVSDQSVEETSENFLN